MGKCYQLVRENTPMDNLCYKSLKDAKRAMKMANDQFKEYNQMLKNQNIDRQPIKMVKIRMINFNRKQNVL
ncbi:MAG: hypothetical protein AABY22_13695 [Nanoarchaeota archaeon]